jgi:DNA repair protein RecO (recombination protein O)
MLTDSDAVILQVQDYRESDLIVSFLTPDHGRLRGIARGAKRSRRRFGGCLEPFVRVTLHYTLTDELCPLQGADLATPHTGIRQELSRLALAGYACELATRLLPERMANPRVYRLLAACLDYLDAADPLPSDRRFYEANLLNILGYVHLGEECEGCGAPLEGCETLSFRPGACTLLCPSCGPARHRLSRQTALLLRQSLARGRFGAIVFPPAQLQEAGLLLDAAIGALLSHPLRSLPFLEEMG